MSKGRDRAARERRDAGHWLTLRDMAHAYALPPRQCSRHLWSLIAEGQIQHRVREDGERVFRLSRPASSVTR